jgi:hypothetical protein
VIGGVDLNAGPSVEQAKIDQILVCVKNQEREGKAMKQMLGTHKQETSEMRKGMDALGPKFDWMIEMVSEIINDCGQIKQAIR